MLKGLTSQHGKGVRSEVAKILAAQLSLGMVRQVDSIFKFELRFESLPQSKGVNY